MNGLSSHLRVYEPLAAFPVEERRRWEAYVESGLAPDRARGLHDQHRSAIVAAIGRLPDAPTDQAFIHRRRGQVYVCPWRWRVRSWQAAVDFRAHLAAEVADAFIPPAAAEEAERGLARARADDPDLKTYTQSVAWQVPIPWFVAFEGEERRLVPDGAATSLTYLASMPDVRRRVARALAVLRRPVGSYDLDREAVQVADLGRWLEDYHPRSLVELDYGGLVRLVDVVELESDESAADVAHALACLGSGDTEEAAEAYGRVTERWSALRSVEVAN